MAVKLLSNILCWHKIIEDALLVDLAVNQVLNRYLLTSIRTLQPLEAILKITMVCSLPSHTEETYEGFNGIINVIILHRLLTFYPVHGFFMELLHLKN